MNWCWKKRGVILVLAVLALLAGCNRGLDEDSRGSIENSKDPLEDLTYLESGAMIPRLTVEGKDRAKEIVLNDSRVQHLIEGQNYAVAQKYGELTVNTRVGIWHTSEDLRVIDAALTIWFDKPYTIKYGWSTLDYDEEKYPYPYYQVETMFRELSVQALMLNVDFAEERVVAIMPLNFGLD
jgi:hypothetical protein